jgi:RNA polymerase sigma-70 factor (ECF subfamily)
LVSDDELVSRVAREDEEAFLTLYDRYASRVYALALRMARDPQTAEEITQDAFVKVWSRARGYLSERGAFAAWLLTITRNTALDRLRLERRRPPSAGEDDPEETWDLLADERLLPEEARWRSLYFTIQALPAEQRQVIELAYYQGLSHSEIAEHLGWPIGTVKTRLRLGMDHLRKQWLEEERPDYQKSKPDAPDVNKDME